MGTVANMAVMPVGWRASLRALAAFVQRSIPRKQTVEMSVEKSVSLGQKSNAVLLNVNGERLLLGVTADSVSVLRQWQQREEIEVQGLVR